MTRLSLLHRNNNINNIKKMLKTKENLLTQSTKKFLKLVRSNGAVRPSSYPDSIPSWTSRVFLSLPPRSRSQRAKSSSPTSSPSSSSSSSSPSPSSTIQSTTPQVCHPDSAIEKVIELAQCFPRVRLESECEGLASKVTEYLCINFYVSVFALICPRNTALPEEKKRRLQYCFRQAHPFIGPRSSATSRSASRPHSSASTPPGGFPPTRRASSSES